jgi:hypothetical protein
MIIWVVELHFVSAVSFPALNFAGMLMGK